MINLRLDFALPRISVVSFTLFVISTFAVLSSAEAQSARRSQQEKSIPKKAPATNDFMKVKLKHSQTLVEGLTLENFDKLEKSAEELLLLSQKADWNTLKTDKYLSMSNDFRATVRRLQKSAKNRNLDASTIAYFEVTLSCVRCHKYVRGQK